MGGAAINAPEKHEISFMARSESPIGLCRGGFVLEVLFGDIY